MKKKDKPKIVKGHYPNPLNTELVMITDLRHEPVFGWVGKNNPTAGNKNWQEVNIVYPKP